ncbi:hypothetical protein LCGC14_0140460 [marine sediment metagenome]|uniref:Uncharacterized protein n=1 Tax=marine sediment metagenome TaxID=412755 RepID=A0A0F9V0R4_9ZZZZ
MNNMGIEENDPGGQEFYQDISDMFKEMAQETLPVSCGEIGTDWRRKACEVQVRAAIDSVGVMRLLSGLAEVLAEKTECPHFEWLSNNFNRLVNKAVEHNQATNLPFGP